MKLFRPSFLAFILTIAALSFSSCEEEEPLSARDDLAGPQEFDINIPQDSIITGGGNGGGTGGGGINEFFFASIDGTVSNFDVYSYEDIGSSVVFSGTNSNNQRKINFSILGGVSSGQSFDLNTSPHSASYRDSAIQFISRRGTLFIDTIAADYIKGIFYFDAVNQSNPADSVIITSGAFQIEI